MRKSEDDWMVGTSNPSASAQELFTDSREFRLQPVDSKFKGAENSGRRSTGVETQRSWRVPALRQLQDGLTKIRSSPIRGGPVPLYNGSRAPRRSAAGLQQVVVSLGDRRSREKATGLAGQGHALYPWREVKGLRCALGSKHANVSV